MRNKEKIIETILLTVNIAVCIILTGIAAYRAGSYNMNALLNLTWAAPLLYMFLILIPTGGNFFSVRYTILNVAIIALCTVFKLLPPIESSDWFRWWYPLIPGLLLQWWTYLDGQ